MKKIFNLSLILGLLCITAVSCSKYDDSELWGKVDDLDKRVTTIESQLTQMNSDIQAIRALLDAQQNKVSILRVEDTSDGYVIVLTDGSRINIRNGQNGKDGQNGQDGKDGVDGKDGADGLTPQIGVELDGDTYYWTITIDGKTTWLLDKDGNRIQAVGHDGKDGADGKDGVDGKDGQDATGGSTVIMPIIKVDLNGYWVISYDNGVTWEYITDMYGSPIKAGGGSNNSVIVNFYQDGDYYVFILSNGTEIRIKSCACSGGATSGSDITDIIPKWITDKMENYMPIYYDTNPPKVEGTYLISPFVTVYCEDYGNGGYAPGDIVTDQVIGFFNQNMTTLTLDYKGCDPSQTNYEKGDGSYIRGKDNNYTVYFATEGISRGIYTKTALLMSGTKTSTGIQNLHFAFVMVDKGDDPNHVLMEVGVFRVFKDKDGLAANHNFTFKFKPAKMPGTENVDELTSLWYDFIKNK